MTDRGVGPVVGLVILVGLGALFAVSLLVFTGGLLDDAQASAETQQVENTMSEFSQSTQRLAKGEPAQEDVDVPNEQADATVNESAGHVTMVLVGPGGDETIFDEDLGVYRYEMEDGTEVAHQGGGIWRRQDGHTTLVAPPEFEYRQRPDATLNFPLPRIAAAPTDSVTEEATLRVDSRRDVYPGDEGTNPVEGEVLYIDIQSRYCEGWEQHVTDRTDGSLEEGCADSGATSSPDELRVNLTVPSEDPEYRTEGVGLYSEENITANETTLTVNGSLGAGSQIATENTTLNHDGPLAEGVQTIREPHDDEIEALVDEPDSDSDWESFCNGPYDYSCTYEGNQTVYVDDFNNGSAQVDFDLSEGDLTLVVDDDVVFWDYTQWDVQNHDGERSVELYTTGDVVFGEGTIQIGDDTGPDSVDALSPTDATDYDPEALQFRAESDTEVVFEGGNPKVAATLSAPSAGTGNLSRTYAAASSVTVEWVGSIYVGRMNLSQMFLDFYQPADLGAGDLTELEAYGGSSGAELYYLHLSEVVLEVEE